MSNKSLLLKIFFALTSAESVFALLALLALPSDAKNAALFGFSASRLILLGGVIFIFLIAIALQMLVLQFIYRGGNCAGWVYRFVDVCRVEWNWNLPAETLSARWGSSSMIHLSPLRRGTG